MNARATYRNEKRQPTRALQVKVVRRADAPPRRVSKGSVLECHAVRHPQRLARLANNSTTRGASARQWCHVAVAPPCPEATVHATKRISVVRCGFKMQRDCITSSGTSYNKTVAVDREAYEDMTRPTCSDAAVLLPSTSNLPTNNTKISCDGPNIAFRS